MSSMSEKLRPRLPAATAGIAILSCLLIASCGEKEKSPRGSGGPAQPVGLLAEGERQPAPDVTLRDVEGRSVRLADYRGKVVLLNFWATWCPPCRVEIPDFIALQRELGPQGLQIVGISLDDEGAPKVGPFASQNGINYAMLVNGQDAAKAYGGIDGIPATFLIDRAGRVVERRVGVTTRDHWRRVIQALLAEPQS